MNSVTLRFRAGPCIVEPEDTRYWPVNPLARTLCDISEEDCFSHWQVDLLRALFNVEVVA